MFPFQLFHLREGMKLNKHDKKEHMCLVVGIYFNFTKVFFSFYLILFLYYAKYAFSFRTLSTNMQCF